VSAAVARSGPEPIEGGCPKTEGQGRIDIYCKAAYLTAETALGRKAIEEVMRRSYAADIDEVPHRWALARVVDGVPVSYILVDPNREMAYPHGNVRYAFICDVATRSDRRHEGHFRAIVEHVFSLLSNAGVALVLTHGPSTLYRRFGFDVFTHHSGLFVTPGQIEHTLGTANTGDGQRLLTVETHRALWEDLLLVTEVRADSWLEGVAALQAAACLARARAKSRILFEHPSAPSYGSRYPIHASLETPVASLARTCGAKACVQGADPEGSPIPDADWIKVLDGAAFVLATLEAVGADGCRCPPGAVCLETDAGAVTIASHGDRVVAEAGVRRGAVTVQLSSAALAQLVTGYRPIELLAAVHGIDLPADAVALLQALYPQRWRLSRNESWTFHA
jgi:predicted N-acetyltransferase YhbS